MIAAVAACCVFAAVWLLGTPPPAARRLARLRATAAATGVRAYDPGRTPYVSLILAWTRAAHDALGGRRRAVAARRASMVELCDGIAAELAAGRPPAAALVTAADALPDLPALRPAMAAARAGEDVAAALERASPVPGCEALRLLAGCWRIGVERGGLLAAVVEGLADALRDEQAHRDEVALQLAGPRATARLLAGLPVLGLLMAVALGARPFAFLFGTLPGGACLILGVGLDALGLWWTRRLASAAEDAR